MEKLNFEHHYSSLQRHMILQKSGWWFAAQEKNYITINVEKSCAWYFGGNYIFSRFYDEMNV